MFLTLKISQLVNLLLNIIIFLERDYYIIVNISEIFYSKYKVYI